MRSQKMVENKKKFTFKYRFLCSWAVAHAFISSAQEAEAGRSELRPGTRGYGETQSRKPKDSCV